MAQHHGKITMTTPDYQSLTGQMREEIGTLLSNTYLSEIRTVAEIATTSTVTASNVTVTNSGNIVGVGTIRSANSVTKNIQVSGNATVNNLLVKGTFSGPQVIATNVSASNQPNITQVGTLANLTSSGFIHATGDISSSGLVKGATLEGSLVTASQPNITAVGTIANLVATRATVTNAKIINLDVDNISTTSSTITRKEVTSIPDGKLILANTASTPAAANGAAIVVGSITTPYASITYIHDDSSAEPDLWDFGPAIRATTLHGDGFNITNIDAGSVEGVVDSAAEAELANIANIAIVANSVAGANVTGWVPNANVANFAYSVTGSNVVGQVANSAYSMTANTANVAFKVAAANVEGVVPQAITSETSTTANSIRVLEPVYRTTPSKMITADPTDTTHSPKNGNAGDIYIDSTNNRLYICYGGHTWYYVNLTQLV